MYDGNTPACTSENIQAAPKTLPICIEVPAAVISCFMNSFPHRDAGVCLDRSNSMAETLVYASADPETMATAAMRPVPAVWSSKMGPGRAAQTIMNMLVAIHRKIAGIIDLRGLKNDAEIDIIGEATNRAFCDIKCALL